MDPEAPNDLEHLSELLREALLELGEQIAAEPYDPAHAWTLANRLWAAGVRPTALDLDHLPA